MTPSKLHDLRRGIAKQMLDAFAADLTARGWNVNETVLVYNHGLGWTARISIGGLARAAGEAHPVLAVERCYADVDRWCSELEAKRTETTTQEPERV